jgi:hypothetical protein
MMALIPKSYLGECPAFEPLTFGAFMTVLSTETLGEIAQIRAL